MQRHLSLSFLSQLHYNDIDDGEPKGRLNERMPYVLGGEPKFVRERYIRVEAIVIVIVEGSTHICVNRRISNQQPQPVPSVAHKWTYHSDDI